MSSALLFPLLALSASASPLSIRQTAVNTTAPANTSTTTPSSSQNYANSTSTIIIDPPVITKDTVKRGIVRQQTVSIVIPPDA